MVKNATRAARANGSANPADEPVMVVQPATGLNAIVSLEIVSGKVQTPKIKGDHLKNKEIRQALVLASTLLAVKLFDTYKKEVY